MWYDDAWLYRVPITVDNTKVTADQTDFIVYVDLANLPTEFHTNVKAAGADVRVTKSDGTTELAREIDYNESTDTGELHFKATGTLSSTVDTTFYIYYGNSGASEPAEDATYGSENTWTRYQARYSMKDLTTSTIRDSTANDNDGTKRAANEPVSATGKLGTGQDFDGTNDYITGGSGASVDNMLIGAGTFSAWINVDAIGSNGRIVQKRDGSNNNGWLFFVDATNSLGGITVAGGSVDAQSRGADNAITLDTWQLVHFRFTNSAPREIELFVNGVEISYDIHTGGTTTPGGDAAGTLYIGNDSTGTPDFDGTIDELRLETTALDTSWMVTQYNNQNSPSTFYTVGSEQKVAFLEPDGDDSVAWTTSSGTAHWSLIDKNVIQPDAVTTTDYIQASGDGPAGAITDDFTTETVASVDSASRITVWVNAAKTGGTGTAELRANIFTGGSWGTIQVIKSDTTFSQGWFSATFTGSYTQSDIDALKIRVQWEAETSPTNDQTVQVYQMYAEVIYVEGGAAPAQLKNVLFTGGGLG